MSKQTEYSRKYESKFKSMRLKFTPEQMEDLNAYCEKQGVPKSSFCVDLILRTIYGENSNELHK